LLVHGDAMNDSHWLTTEDFLEAIRVELEAQLAG
jgi:hypothetical protein